MEDAPTREDGEFKSGSGYAVNLESATSATILNRRTENMANWESLIGERMRPAATVHRIEDPVQRNRVENGKRRSKRFRDNHPDYDAEYYASHKEKMRANADKWKREHPEAMREYARQYRARHKDDPAYKAKKKIYNDTYRGKLKKAA